MTGFQLLRCCHRGVLPVNVHQIGVVLLSTGSLAFLFVVTHFSLHLLIRLLRPILDLDQLVLASTRHLELKCILLLLATTLRLEWSHIVQ